MLETVSTRGSETSRPPFPDMVWIPGGEFRMGSEVHYPEEAPVHSVQVDGFWMDRTPVTNRDFRKFVDETGYVTYAEIAPRAADYPGALPEMLRPGSLVFNKPQGRVDSQLCNWWSFVHGAHWKRPLGVRSSLEGIEDHPVVHIAWRDCVAYAKWSGKEIPTEAEWEFASRGGLEGAEYSWGAELTPDGKMMANFWQGEFPWQNLKTDGFERTSPVGAFPPNGYGLVDVIGNVWEWTSDWFRAQHDSEPLKACCMPKNPRGGKEEESYDPVERIRIPRKVLKGGSHLCAPNYCRRYRPAARFPHPVDTSTSHVGFRCIVRQTQANS